jgi:hypothetical protein
MPVQGPVAIPFPLSSFPGTNPQESEGRLINFYADVLGELQEKKWKWVRSAGLSLFAPTANSGYRGGLVVNSLSFECWANIAEMVDVTGNVTSIGAFPGTGKVSIARNNAAPTPDVVAVDPAVGAFVLDSATVIAATAKATIGGTVFNSSDVVTIDILNPALSPPFPVTISYTLGAGETATSIALALKTAINANATLIAANISAAVLGPVITISHQGQIGNQTSLVGAVTTGSETITFTPASGNLSGGQGTYGAFTGAPTAYTGQGSMPQPNSVCFQDGYLFFTTGAGQVYATTLNGLLMNALTYITVQAKADVELLRGIAYSGLLLLFTTGSLEVWQDAAIPAPNFPYSRLVVLEFGLIQSAAIAGWETGFSELLWVAQDFSVHWMTAGALSQIIVSPPDLDRLIEAQVRAGNTLEAGCYITAGKKFWTLSSPNWTWEFNLQTKKWNERWSLTTAGVYGRWRGTGGHPAFGKWLMGDEQTGDMLVIDDTNRTDVGMPMLSRLESAPVKKFPMQVRVARADFDFVVGVGEAVGSLKVDVTGAVAGPDGDTRLSVSSTIDMETGDVVQVSGVLGTTEANGVWPITVIDDVTIELEKCTFTHAYGSGGVVVDLTSPPSAQAPQVAISMSKDGGLEWGNPLLRALGAQSKVLRSRVSVLNMGLSGTMGVRWRLDITDPVYASFMGATQSSDIRAIGS